MSNEEEEREKIELEETKKKSISNMVKAVELLQRSIQESCRARTQKDLKALLVLPLKKSLDSKEEKIANLRYHFFFYKFETAEPSGFKSVRCLKNNSIFKEQNISQKREIISFGYF